MLFTCVVASQLKGTSRTLRSRPSGPLIACSTMAQSSTERQIGPSLSMLQESAIAPVRGIRPKVGRRPLEPQRDDGEEIEPRVSDPMENAMHPAAVAEAEPADEPLEPSCGSHGSRVFPPNQTSP